MNWSDKMNLAASVARGSAGDHFIDDWWHR
jgi:hypothetical protein